MTKPMKTWDGYRQHAADLGSSLPSAPLCFEQVEFILIQGLADLERQATDETGRGMEPGTLRKLARKLSRFASELED